MGLCFVMLSFIVFCQKNKKLSGTLVCKCREAIFKHKLLSWFLEESSLHLLLHCSVASLVWLRLMSWLDAYFITPPNLFIHWECLGGGGIRILKRVVGLFGFQPYGCCGKSGMRRFSMGEIFEVDEIVEEIKVMSWRWLLSRTNIPVCLFFEWSWNPIWCLRREGRS